MGARPRYLTVAHRPRRRASRLLWLLLLVGWGAAFLFGTGYLPPLIDGGSFQNPLQPKPADEPAPAEPAPAAPRAVDLIHPGYELAVAGAEGWNYHRSLRGDLTGDGRPEAIHLIAKVETFGDGPDRFAWDDGHLWQVYVEDGDGARTHLFSRWVQLGEVRVALLDPAGEAGARGLLIMALEGAGVGVYRVDYRGPGDFQAYELLRAPILAEAGPAS